MLGRRAGVTKTRDRKRVLEIPVLLRATPFLSLTSTQQQCFQASRNIWFKSFSPRYSVIIGLRVHQVATWFSKHSGLISSALRIIADVLAFCLLIRSGHSMPASTARGFSEILSKRITVFGHRDVYSYDEYLSHCSRKDPVCRPAYQLHESRSITITRCKNCHNP